VPKTKRTTLPGGDDLVADVGVVLGHGLGDVAGDRAGDDLARDVVERAPEAVDGELPLDPTWLSTR
jgi:hypothetical protein